MTLAPIPGEVWAPAIAPDGSTVEGYLISTAGRCWSQINRMTIASETQNGRIWTRVNGKRISVSLAASVLCAFDRLPTTGKHAKRCNGLLWDCSLDNLHWSDEPDLGALLGMLAQWRRQGALSVAAEIEGIGAGRAHRWLRWVEKRHGLERGTDGYLDACTMAVRAEHEVRNARRAVKVAWGVRYPLDIGPGTVPA